MTLKRFKFRVEKQKATGRGFTGWVHPNPAAYFMACCDCGLVHEVQFRAGTKSRERKNGSFIWGDLPPSKYGVKFRARRADAYTAHLRATTKRKVKS